MTRPTTIATTGIFPPELASLNRCFNSCSSMRMCSGSTYVGPMEANKFAPVPWSDRYPSFFRAHVRHMILDHHTNDGRRCVKITFIHASPFLRPGFARSRLIGSHMQEHFRDVSESKKDGVSSSRSRGLPDTHLIKTSFPHDDLSEAVG